MLCIVAWDKFVAGSVELVTELTLKKTQLTESNLREVGHRESNLRLSNVG